MAGWLDIQVISDILNLKNDSILKSIQRGKFTKIRQQKVTGKGARGGKIWQIHITDPAIPQDKREAWLKSHGENANLPAVIEQKALVITTEKPLQELAELKGWQTRTMDARLAIIRYIEASARAVGISEAVATIVKQAHSADLPEQLQTLIRTANKRSGQDAGKRTLSSSTLYRWLREYKAAGNNYAALAPKAIEKDAIPPWAAAFLKAYRVPQKISVAMALEDMKAELPPGIPVPSESQAYRFIEKMSRLDIQRGRKAYHDSDTYQWRLSQNETLSSSSMARRQTSSGKEVVTAH
jgi:putative transposase